ncbi:hypothetical protein CDD83_9299 [Cordyceps sp. RAO-2017]|nr:hypothetical protein CDD83_9299 [Cordyceps sp. RAO-2017]
MSEDDIDMLGPDGQGSVRVDRDRRAPRFSWTPAYETTFFRSLCDSVQLGLRENSSFKAEAWERAAQALQDSHGAYPAKSHLINKSDNARKRFRLWRGLREDPEFLYNAVAKTVTASEEAWRAHIEREPLSRALRGRPFDHEDFMEILYPDVVGSGGAPKRIMRPKRRLDGQPVDETDMPGAGILNLPLDASPGPVAESAEKQRASSTMVTTGHANGSMIPTARPTSAPTPTKTVPGPPPTPTPAAAPPDESANQAKKRAWPQEAADSAFDPLPVSTAAAAAPNSNNNTTTNTTNTNNNNGLHNGASPGKRARTAAQLEYLSCASAASASASALAMGGAAVTTTAPSSSNMNPTVGGSMEEAETRSRGGLRWQEAALDLFFREFADQDLDLQIKISEMVLCDEHRALMFCKMPWQVRQHWVRRLGEAHYKTT